MRWFVRARSPITLNWRVWVTFHRRVTQIVVLLHLAPAIQEYILFLSAADARFITELGCAKLRASCAGIASANHSS